MKNKLKEFRKKAGFTQEQLAQKVNCSVRTIRYYEAGKLIPNLNIASKIITALKVASLNEIWEAI